MARLFSIFIIFIVVLSSGCVQPHYMILHEDQAIVVDGMSDEKVWEKTYGYGAFLNSWDTTAIQQTLFRSFIDDDFFYFHFDVIDKVVVCGENQDTDLAVEYSDRVELFFSIDSSMSKYYGLEFDACGRTQEFHSHGYRNFVKDWSFPKLTATDYVAKKTTEGYKIEGRLSLDALSELGIFNSNYILLGVFRADFHDKNNKKDVDWISWKKVGTENPDFHTLAGFKKIQFGRKSAKSQ